LEILHVYRDFNAVAVVFFQIQGGIGIHLLLILKIIFAEITYRKTADNVDATISVKKKRSSKFSWLEYP